MDVVLIRKLQPADHSMRVVQLRKLVLKLNLDVAPIKYHQLKVSRTKDVHHQFVNQHYLDVVGINKPLLKVLTMKDVLLKQQRNLQQLQKHQLNQQQKNQSLKLKDQLNLRNQEQHLNQNIVMNQLMAVVLMEFQKLLVLIIMVVKMLLLVLNPDQILLNVKIHHMDVAKIIVRLLMVPTKKVVLNV